MKKIPRILDDDIIFLLPSYIIIHLYLNLIPQSSGSYMDLRKTARHILTLFALQEVHGADAGKLLVGQCLARAEKKIGEVENSF